MVHHVERDLQEVRRRVARVQRNVPGTNFNAIAFNPAGTVGIAVGDAGAFYRFNGVDLGRSSPALKTYNYPYDELPELGLGRRTR